MAKCGKSDIELGARVKIKGIKGEDSCLNGLIGTATHPFAFGCTNKGWIGIHLDAGSVAARWGGKANVRQLEVEILD